MLKPIFSGMTSPLVLKRLGGVFGVMGVTSKRFILSLAESVPANNGPRQQSRNIEDHKRVVPIFKKALEFPNRIAIRDSMGEWSYIGLLASAIDLAKEISKLLKGNKQERVTIVCPHDASYVVAQWASWISGQICVPLSARIPHPLMEYLMTDSDSNILITVPEFEPQMKDIAVKIGCKVLVIKDETRKKGLVRASGIGSSPTTAPSSSTTASKAPNVPPPSSPSEVQEALQKFLSNSDPDFYNEANALILYTSGATGTPKGVLLSHSNLQAQVNSLICAWDWAPKDCLLNVLPLNHIHGIVNALLCPLSVGARCVLRKFDTGDVWTELMGVQRAAVDRVNMLMGVPAMYSMLIDEYDTSLRKTDRMVDYIRTTCSQKIRVFISGSAPLPRLVFERWEQITGHQLLERYGMTETGMTMSNPLHGSRSHGSVGLPLPGIHVRVASEEGGVIAEGSNMGTRVLTLSDSVPTGILQVHAKTVFKQYWRKPNATSREFTKDGWFNTGDVVQYSKGVYNILGRHSVDMIYVGGGVKVSAILVESALLDYEPIRDVAVVGLGSKNSPQRIGAVVSIKSDRRLDIDSLKAWAATRLPKDSIPSELVVVNRLPRNPMGKVDKAALAQEFFSKIEKQ